MGDQKDNVKVAIRVRPFNDREIQEVAKTCISISEPSNSISIDVKSEQKCFTYDYVGSESISQEEIFNEIGKPIATSCLVGYNGTIFAYGQTGAGKTFTILGNSESDSESQSRGLLPRCFEYLFNAIHEETTKEYLIKCSYLEIYQEQINDLLGPDTQSLALREDMKRGVYVENLIEEPVFTVNETYNLLRIGTQNRHVGSTSMNKESSRSHSVFTLLIESKEEKDSMVSYVNRRFHLIDLAGSERQKATDCAGERLKEAGMINKSLSALGNVINSLVDISEGKSRHIHYRDSKLTFLLKDSLGGNSKTCIVANISPAFSAANETLSTLKFAQRAKMIRNSAVVNEETSGAIAILKYEIKRLKEELSYSKANALCPKCEIGNDKDLSEILEKTLKIKQEDTKMFVKNSDLHEEQVATLKSNVAKLENKINHDKMVLKFRDATIQRLQNALPDENLEVCNLKIEVKTLRDEVEIGNRELSSLCMENMLLREEIENVSKMNKYEEKLIEFEEVTCGLAEALRISRDEKKNLEREIEAGQGIKMEKHAEVVRENKELKEMLEDNKSNEEFKEVQKQKELVEAELRILQCTSQQKEAELNLKVLNLIQNLQNTNSLLTESTMACNTLEKKHCSLEKIHTSLQKQFSDQESLVFSLKTTSADITKTEDYKSLVGQISELKKNSDSQTSDLSKVLSAKAILESELTSALSQIEIVKLSLSDSITEKFQSEEQLKKFQQDFAILKQDFAKLKQDRDIKLSEANKEIKYLEHELNTLNESKQLTSELQAKVFSLSEDLQKVKSSSLVFQELNQSLAQKNLELSTALEKTHTSHVPLFIVDQLRQDLVKTHEELQKSHEELMILKEENRKKLEILKNTKSSIKSTKEEIASWKRCIDEKNATIQELRTEIKKYRNEEGENHECVYLRNLVQGKEKEIKELKGEDFKKKCGELQGEVNGLKEEIKKMSYDRCKTGIMRDLDEVTVKR